MAKTEQTIEDIEQILTGLIRVAPDVLAIVNTIKTNGSISLADLQGLQALRQAAVAEADQALGG